MPIYSIAVTVVAQIAVALIASIAKHVNSARTSLVNVRTLDTMTNKKSFRDSRLAQQRTNMSNKTILNNNKLTLSLLLLSIAISTQLLQRAEVLLGKGTFGAGLLAYPLSLAVSMIISGCVLLIAVLFIKWLHT